MTAPAVAADPALTRALSEAVAARGLPVVRLASGAGHDAVALSALTGVAMLFVRCAGGISHHPDESVDEADVAVALDVLHDFVRGLVP
jgi:allantoate deiminase